MQKTKPKQPRVHVVADEDGLGLVITANRLAHVGRAQHALRDGHVQVISSLGGELHLAIDERGRRAVVALLEGVGFHVAEEK